MHTPLVKSHHNTTNIYVRLAIIKENIATIDLFLNNRKGANISFYTHKQILETRKNQVYLKNHFEQEIARFEQGSFAFGS